MARILGASAQMRVKHLLRELNHVRKMDSASVRNSIMKAADDKTAPEDPFMLSQVGTIIKRIRAKTDPSGSAELGLAAKEAGIVNRVAASIPKVKVPVAVPNVNVPSAPAVAKAPARQRIDPVHGEPIGFHDPKDLGLFRGMMRGKISAQQAMALLKVALLRNSA